MIQIAEHFVKKKIERHGNLPVLPICDNLDAHCHGPVVEVFSKGNVFVLFVVKNCTDCIQPIDAGIGRCMRVYVGHALDDWLGVDENLDRWENGIPAPERRILMTHFLERAMREVLSTLKQRMRIGCFERTGCLIKLHPGESDKLVRPQGLKLPFVIPGGSHESNAAMPQPPQETMPSSSIEEDLEDSIDDVPEGEDEGDISPEGEEEEEGGTDGQFLSCGGGDLGSFLNFRLI